MNVRVRCLLGSILALFLALSCCFAEVSLKNGNFFVGHTDIQYPGGFEPKIERIYNSKTSFRGIFGNGWGMEFEVYLDIDPEGAITLHEYGGGADNHFVSANMKAADVTLAAEKIMTAAKENHDIASPSEIDEYRQHLIGDNVFRSSEWKKYIKLGLVKPAQLEIGTSLISDHFSYQSIVRLASGYERHFDNGRRETFDERGKLTRILDSNGNYVQFSYDVRNRIQILDNYGRRIMLVFDDHNLVERIEGDNGKVANYRYNDRQELIYARDSNDNVYRYEYDPRHNLTAIHYSDGTSMAVSYWPLEQFENVRSVTDRDGSITNYEYWLDPSDPGHYRITVAVENADKSPISHSVYEYFNKRKGDGEEYTARMITDIDGDRTDTTYEESGLPLRIVRGTENTKFEYDEFGHVTRKETPAEVTELKYDSAVHKVAYVRHISKTDPKDVTWFEYQYDDKGNLLEAVNDQGTKVRLKYDGLGRIAELVRQDGAVLQFAYNRNSKPTEISLVHGKETATITVHYTPDGEIEKVDSAAGRTVALKVTSAFQQLLDIIRPAGVTLSF